MSLTRAQPPLLDQPEGPGAFTPVDTRLQRYQRSGPIIQELLDHIYRFQGGFVSATVRSPWEDPIWAYNDVMGIDGLVRAIADRYQLVLDSDEDADIAFIDAITRTES